MKLIFFTLLGTYGKQLHVLILSLFQLQVFYGYMFAKHAENVVQFYNAQFYVILTFFTHSSECWFEEFTCKGSFSIQ